METKHRGGRVGDSNILTFRPTVLDKKCHFPAYFIHICPFIKLKKLHVGQFFLFVFVKFRNS